MRNNRQIIIRFSFGVMLSLVLQLGTAPARAYTVTNFTGNFLPAATLTVGTLPFSVAAADVNGDGKPDLIAGNQGRVTAKGNTLSVYLNNGGGKFTASATLTVDNGPRSEAAADLNGDGKVDLITANYFNSSLSVLMNNGSGGFPVAVSLGVGAIPYAVTTSDVNGDGKIDLICAASTNRVGVLTNNGSGGFPSVTFYPVGMTPMGVAAADVNGDGRPDIISANTGGGTVTVLMNNGSGGFMTTSATGAGGSPYCVAPADVNGDGKVDLVVANEVNPGVVTVLTNSGAGSFAISGSYPVGAFAYSVCTADVNSDGKMDIIASSGNETALYVLTNDASGGFVLAGTPAIGGGATGVIATDLNGDGGVDLVSANFSANNLSVLTNTFVVTYPPLLTDFSPTNGIAGTSVTLLGTNLVGVTNVWFNGLSAAFSISSATQIVATVPATASTGFITVAGTNGLATSTNRFYVPPVITGFSPTNGGFDTLLTITGLNLNGTTSVTVGGADASFTNISDTQVSVVVPAGAVTGYITLMSTNGTAVSSNQFDFIYPPVISGFSPASGAPGTTVVIQGTNFTTATSVRFGGTPAGFNINSDSQITATVPYCAGTGPITIVTLGGTVLSDNFVFVRGSITLTIADETTFAEALCSYSNVVLSLDPLFGRTISLTSPKMISSDVILDGTGHDVTLDGNGLTGIFAVNPGVHLTLRGLTLANGNAVNAGGAIFNNAGFVTIENCLFTNNLASGNTNTPATGGAIDNQSGLVVINGTTFAGNSVAGGIGLTGSQGVGQYGVGGTGGGGQYAMGGAIYNGGGGTVLVTNCTFYNNSAIGGAGGPGGRGYDGYSYQYICGSYQCGFSTCYYYCTAYVYGGAGGQGGNGSIGYGGNIYNDFGSVIVVNSTLAAGAAAGGNGGVAGSAGNYGSGSYGSGMPGSGSGGNVGFGSGQLAVKNSIIADAQSGGNYWGGAMTDLGNNLSSDGTPAFTQTTSLVNVNPNLGPLADNGGLTWTMALLPASPAIRAGDTNGAPLVDQRGQPRKAMQIDLGAFETPVTPSSLPSVLAGTKTSYAGSFNLTFVNTPGTSFSIWSSTNLLLPVNDWTWLGFAREIAPGQFQFSDTSSTNDWSRFYRVSSP